MDCHVHAPPIGDAGRIGVQKKYPEALTLEALKDKYNPVSDQVIVNLDSTPPYEKSAPRALKIFKKEKSVNKVARIMGITWKAAKQMVEFATDDRRPTWSKPGKKRAKGSEKKESKTKLIGPDVVRLKNEEVLSWPAIVKWLKDNRGITVSEGTVAAAWDEMYRNDPAKQNVESAFTPERQRYSHLGESVYRRIREGLAAGKRPKEIARLVGCSVSTVRREFSRQRERAN
jgi:hypothetical protein